MAQINVTHLTFEYEGSFDKIFDDVSFVLDTDWKLGFIGRNGKGKTTFLNLLQGKMSYTGSIQSPALFDYFPYEITKKQLEQNGEELLEVMKPGCELWRVICELDKMQVDAEVLYRPFKTLSHGERTKVMLAVLFSGDQEFLLIDEPTNHLDQDSREIVKNYLGSKKGFILVSHDRDFLDHCIDHVLVLNRQTIEVQSGNFSSWWENKRRKDNFSLMENEKHLREIKKLKTAAQQKRQWADKNENTKIGFDPIKEHDRCLSTRSFIAAKTKKMQSQRKQLQERMSREISEKEGLLQDIENPTDLKIMPQTFHKELLVSARDFSLTYANAKAPVLSHLGFQINQGDRVFLHGKNGCGKSSLIKAILAHAGMYTGTDVFSESGTLTVASGLKISYINQDTSFLTGSISHFCQKNNLEESLFCAILRQLDFERTQLVKNMEEYSQGQKKKVLIAASLLTPAHLYIWDEPMNYVDVFSRMQIENLIEKYTPTMLIVDHDVRFREKIATSVIPLDDKSCY